MPEYNLNTTVCLVYSLCKAIKNCVDSMWYICRYIAYPRQIYGMNTKIPIYARYMEWIPKSRLKSNLENSRSEFEQCTSIEKVWCTPHWGTDIWILYSRPTDTLHRNIEILHPLVFNTHFQAFSIAFSYLEVSDALMLVFISVFVLLSTGAVQRVKSMSGSKKSQGGWLLPTELWDRKMRGGLYMRRVSARNEFGIPFCYFSYSQSFLLLQKEGLKIKYFSWNM